MSVHMHMQIEPSGLNGAKFALYEPHKRSWSLTGTEALIHKSHSA